MELKKSKAIIQAILFAAGREVKLNEIMSALELGKDETMTVMESLISDLKSEESGIEIIKINDGFQMCSKKEYSEFIYPIIDKRTKPNLSTAALETLSIIAYNPKITRSEIENIRGVGCDGTIYKLLEYGLIEEAGRMDAPGRPTTYRTTNDFLKKFGYANLEELPELPKYRIDENEQIVIDDLEAPSPTEPKEDTQAENTFEPQADATEKSNQLLIKKRKNHLQKCKKNKKSKKRRKKR